MFSPVPYWNKNSRMLCAAYPQAVSERAEGSMKSWGGRRGKPSQKFILAQMHSLDYVSAVVKHPSNIFRVYCACEMWITIMFTISTGCTDPLKKSKNTTVNGFTFGGTQRSAVVAVIKNVNNFLLV